jgi:hypothetical protein
VTALTDTAEGTRRWAAARPYLQRSLYLLDVLNGSLPPTSSAMLGHGTRDTISAQLAVVDALLTRASAPALLTHDGTDYWHEPTDSGLGPAWTPELMGGWSSMGQVTSAALRELISGLVTRARARADEQLTALEAYIVGLGEGLTAYFAEWQTALDNLVTVLGTHARGALLTVATGAGRTFYQWCIEWTAAMAAAWQAFRNALTLSAAGLGLLPLGLALALLYAITRRRRGRR